MKIRTLIAANVAVLVLAGISLQAAESTKLYARSGSKMRVEGTSNIHDWRVESPLIGGSIEVGPNFPTEPGQKVEAGTVQASGEAFVTVRSLKSLEKDGKPYSDAMDNIMYEKLGVEKSPRITFKLSELTLKEAAKSADAPYVFEAKGDVTVGGESKTVTMPVNVQPLADKRVKVSGSVPLKMTDFKIEPPAPKVAFGLIKTADDIKVIFEWMVAPRAATK